METRSSLAQVQGHRLAICPVEPVHGSFTACSQPTAGYSYDSPINVTGSVDATNTHYVVSPSAPDPANLPSQEPADVHTGDMISVLLDGQASPTAGAPSPATSGCLPTARTARP